MFTVTCNSCFQFDWSDQDKSSITEKIVQFVSKTQSNNCQLNKACVVRGVCRLNRYSSRVARIFRGGGGGGCVWAVKIQTCMGVRGHAPPGKF